MVLGFVGWNPELLGMKGIVRVLSQPPPAVSNALLDLESATAASIRVRAGVRMWVLARDLGTVLGTLDPKWILGNTEEAYVQPRANGVHPGSSLFLVRTDKNSEAPLCLGRRMRKSVGC